MNRVPYHISIHEWGIVKPGLWFLLCFLGSVCVSVVCLNVPFAMKVEFRKLSRVENTFGSNIPTHFNLALTEYMVSAE